MKNLCFVVDSIFTIGGVQRVTAVIAKALTSRYRVTIVTLDRPEQQDTSLYGLNEADIEYRFLQFHAPRRLKKTLCRAYSALYRKCLWHIGSQRDWWLQRWTADGYAHSSFPSNQRNELYDVLRQGDFDTIVGVHAPLAIRLAAIRSRLPGVRLIGWIHNSVDALFGPTSPYIGPDRKRHYVYQLRKLDQTVVLSHHDAKAYHSYDPSFSPIVVYNPLTIEPGPPSQGTSRQFLAVGRLTPRHKGFDLLVEAFRLFAYDNKEWTLHIVGEGPEEQRLRDMINHYGLEQRVVLHPFTTDVQHYYCGAQVYVLSSRWEGFGLVIVEAMAHGLPVVSSNLPTSLEIMGQAGLYFDNGNVEQLAARLHDATRIDWQQKSSEALQVASRFSLDRITTQWRQIV